MKVFTICDWKKLNDYLTILQSLITRLAMHLVYFVFVCIGQTITCNTT